MKKDLCKILQSGKIRPKDRILLLVADYISTERDGKQILTDADRYALRDGWTPKNNNEVKEYNRYNQAWKDVIYAEFDAQTTYLQATNSFLRASKLITYLLLQDKKREGIKDFIANKTKKHLTEAVEHTITTLEGETQKGKALELTLDFMGYELDDLIYFYAFELAGKELQQDLLTLYPDSETERDYLTEEEAIYNIFNGKEHLTPEGKRQLAEMIADKGYNRHLGLWRLETAYFADIPLRAIAKKTADNNKVAYKEDSLDNDKPLADYAKQNNTTIRDLLIDTILAGLDNQKDGLLQAYGPLFKSEAKETINGKTKLPHNEIFSKWLEAKRQAEATINKLIDEGELRIEQREQEIGNLKKVIEAIARSKTPKKQDKRITKQMTIVNGKSLYNLKGDYAFAKEFKRQAEAFKLLGAIVLFLQRCQFIKDYQQILGFRELFKSLSPIFEIDLTYKINNWLESFKRDYETLSQELLMLADDITREGRFFYQSVNLMESLLAVPFLKGEAEKPDFTGRLKIYFDGFKKTLGDEFILPYEQNGQPDARG